MHRDNLHDRFREAWANPSDYPKTLLRRARPHEVHIRNSHCEKLIEDQDTLFDDEEQKLQIWETGRENRFDERTLTTVDAVRKHLERVDKDPQIRHAFLDSADSRSPLNCSPELLKTVFTYHQVEASFLDAVYTFGDQEDPKDLCLMNFRSDDTLKTPRDKIIAIPELGRSGREIHVSYLLRSVERKPNRDWPWQIRQAAMYHSFDTETGRSMWFTIKGNDEFSRRIKQSSPYLDIPAKQSDKNVGSYFKASLATHLVYLSWCDENWRQFIDDVEAGIRGILERARKAPIDDDLDHETSKLVTYPKSLRETRSRSSTMRSKSQSKTNTGLVGPSIGRQSTWEVVTGAQKSLMAFLDIRAKEKVADVEKAAKQPAAMLVQADSSSEALIDPREVLNEFRFSHVQTLYTFSDRVRRALLTLELNISVLHELHEYYDRLLKSDIDNFGDIKAACKDSLVDFLDEVQSISRRLKTRRSQLECLNTLLMEGNTLYDGILQYRQLDIGQRFQETAQESADQMRVIANKTRLETASMHVITIVTLIFLPATFVATFFQSGVFLWNNDRPEGMTEAYRYRGESFNLFVWVSLPLMLVTLAVWLAVFLRMKKKMGRPLKSQASNEEAAV